MNVRLLIILFLLSALGACGTEEALPIDSDAAPQTCDYTGFSADFELAEKDNENSILFYTARSGQFPQAQLLGFDLYFSLGAKEDPHQFEFTGESLSDCHTCLIMRRNCKKNNCANGTAFLAQAGLAKVRSTSGQLQVSLENLKLAEVTINLGSANTTLVPNGKHWCIDRFDFDQSIE